MTSDRLHLSFTLTLAFYLGLLTLSRAMLWLSLRSPKNPLMMSLDHAASKPCHSTQFLVAYYEPVPKLRELAWTLGLVGLRRGTGRPHPAEFFSPAATGRGALSFVVFHGRRASSTLSWAARGALRGSCTDARYVDAGARV